MASHDKFLNGRESRVFSREEKEVGVWGGGGPQSTKTLLLSLTESLSFFPYWALLSFLGWERAPSGPLTLFSCGCCLFFVTFPILIKIFLGS